MQLQTRCAAWGDPVGSAEDAITAIRGGLATTRTWNDLAVSARVPRCAETRLLG